MTMARRRLWATVAAVVACALAACGGGGGGGGDSSAGGGGGGGGGGSTGAPGTAADLIPAAPTLGATLAADAATLRPIRDGAVWSYRGVRRLGATATPQPYVTTTRQVSTTAGQAQEIASNPGGEGSSDTQPVNIGGGTVGHTEQIDFAGKGVLETVSVVELRSPVREGDQYTMHSRRYTDTAFDTDGDQKPDTLDVAVYGRVVGAETLTLENLPPLKTVRVDVVLRTRLTPSRSNVPTPVLEVTVQTWYAAGIGVVRQLSTAPLASGTDNETSDETLSAWDGITEGFGAMPDVAAVIPAGNADYPSQAVPADTIHGSATLFDGALLMTRLPDHFGDGALAVRLDARGRVLSARAHPGLRTTAAVIAGHVEGLVHLASRSYDFWTTTLDLSRFGADGSVLGTLAGASVDLGGGRSNASLDMPPVAAVDGQILWILWRRLTPSPTGRNSELLLRGYLLDGNPLGPEVLLTSEEVSDLSLSAAGLTALASWTVQAPGSARRYATLSNPQGPAAVDTLASNVTGLGPGSRALRTTNHSVLLWATPLGATVGDGGVAGVRLDGAGQPVLPAGGTLAGARLDNLNAPAIPGAVTAGDRVLFFRGNDGPLWPGDTNPVFADRVVWYTLGTGSLSTSPSYTIRLPQIGANRAIALGDRVLLLSAGGAGLRSSVVWLSAGPP